jgi:hypothetical protein
MELAQLTIDSSISANWVMAGLLAVLLIVMKRSAEAADRREKKIDEILEKQQIQLNNHEVMLNLHRDKIDTLGNDISEHNKSILENMMDKIRAATGGKYKDE